MKQSAIVVKLADVNNLFNDLGSDGLFLSLLIYLTLSHNKMNESFIEWNLIFSINVALFFLGKMQKLIFMAINKHKMTKF